MTEVRFYAWTLDIDSAATMKAYAQLGGGFAESCGCPTCQNFMLQRERLYPDAFRAGLELMGVDWSKEAEAIHLGPIGDGLHGYTGWFHVVGRIVAGPTHAVPACDSRDASPHTDGFKIEVTRSTALVPESFPRTGVLQVEWAGTLPWCVALDEPGE